MIGQDNAGSTRSLVEVKSAHMRWELGPQSHKAARLYDKQRSGQVGRDEVSSTSARASKYDRS
jgi:hypothetical protein